MTFNDLRLEPPLLRAVAEAGYQLPSQIQQQAIPPVLAGRDLLGCAQTGTGKTAAFALPILQNLAPAQSLAPRKAASQNPRPIRALVLTPTRELALQICESFETYGKYLPLRSAVIFGGVGQAPQVAQLRRGVDILVATPGRLCDLIGQGHIRLNSLSVFVLDEADRMLDMGFVHDVKRVITYLPQKRQNLLFSATMPAEIVSLAGGMLHEPAQVFVAPTATTVEQIDQCLYKVDKVNKRHLLAKLLNGGEVLSALVFTRTKHGADKVVRELKRDGIAALAIHGNKSQNARQDALASFKAGKVKALVATDIAARGLDIDALSHVVNYDLPNIPETYVHRIGRTGRAGKTGVAVSFCCCDELAYLRDIEKLIGITIPEEKRHPWPMLQTESAPPAAPKKPPEKAPKTPKAPNTPQNSGKAARPRREAPARPAAAPPPAPPQRGGAAIVTKKPVWASPEGAAGPAPQGEETMSQPTEQRRGRFRDNRGGEGRGAKALAKPPPKTPAKTPPAVAFKPPVKPPPAAAFKAPPAAPPPAQSPRKALRGPGETKREASGDDSGLFNFSEEELASDTSLRIIRPNSRGEAKYASFEDYLKDS